MSQNYNSDESKFTYDFIEDKPNKKLGIILEENNCINSELEKSGEISKEENKENKSQEIEKKFSSCKNYIVNLQIYNNLFVKENDEDKDTYIKYNSLTLPNQNISNLNLFNSIKNFNINNSFEDENKNNEEINKLDNNNNDNNNDIYDKINNNNNNDFINNELKSINKSNKNNSSSQDIIILSSNKKQSELIKLLSSNKIDTISNDNITKNINLNININNNIQYEIEKSKEKEEFDNNSELNKSLNSLLKIAEKNCLYLNDNSPILIDKKENDNNNYKEEKKNKEKYIASPLDTNKSYNSENIGLSLLNPKLAKFNKNELFKRVKSQRIIKDKVQKKENNIKKINEMNKSKEKVYNNKLNNIIPLKETNKNNFKNNILNSNNVYSKKKSCTKNNSINNIRNLSLNKKENKNIYKKIKKFSRNELSIERGHEEMIEGGTLSNKYNNTINKKELNSLNKINNERNSRNKNKIEIKDNNKFEKKNKFFEVNISFNDYLKSEQNENSLEDSYNKIYKRPTRIYTSKNIFKKGKSVDKINNNTLIINEEKSFRKKIKTKKKILNRIKTNNYFIFNNEKQPITYIKKNPHIQINNSNYNINKKLKKKMNYSLGFNINNSFLNKRNINHNDLDKQRKTLNYKIRESPIENYNFKKYNDIYNIYDMKNNNKILNKKNILSFNLEDLMVLEEKLCEIIIEFKKNKKADNQCFDFWNYYFNFSLYQRIEKIFKNEVDEEIARLCLNYELMSILICYEFSVNNEEIIDYTPYIEILQLCHRNLILICEQVLNKICPENQNNIWVLRLSEIVKYSKNSSEQMFSTENYISSITGKINFNTNCLIKKIKNIIYNYKTKENNNILIDFVKNLNQKTYEEINDFFREYIYKVDNYEGSILSSIIKNNIEFSNRICPPYIKEQNLKKYSLVLDLNETLISFKLTTDNQGLVRTRPFLFEFLDSVSKYYEIILFTCSTQNYTDSIVKAIEYNKKYFDYIFYRHHTIVIKNDFVKDLTRIGRPLDSIIIIDNMPQNYRLQKENGINIKSFWGDDSEDTALYDLIPILTNIANQNEDLRDALEKNRDEIVKKITSNIYKHNI